MIPLLAMLAVCIGGPLACAWWLWRLRENCRVAWLVRVLYALAFLALVLMVGRWDVAGAYTRWALALAVLLASARSWVRHARLPWRVPAGTSPWLALGPTLFSLLILAVGSAWVATGYRPGGKILELALPLEGGRFMVGQGGGNTLLNYHHAHRAQSYAVDIVGLDTAGFRAKGLIPADLGRYAIFGARVISPCDGTVRSAKDGFADQAPPRRDARNPAGNHVVIACEGVSVTLAHLRNGSVAVSAGARVSAGDAIGVVGNSGNSTEPHLHIHAETAVDGKGASGVAMMLDGRFPVRNRIYAR